MQTYFDGIYIFIIDIKEDLADIKCQFCAPEISCLGDFVGRAGVRMCDGAHSTLLEEA